MYYSIYIYISAIYKIITFSFIFNFFSYQILDYIITWIGVNSKNNKIIDDSKRGISTNIRDKIDLIFVAKSYYLHNYSIVFSIIISIICWILLLIITHNFINHIYTYYNIQITTENFYTILTIIWLVSSEFEILWINNNVFEESYFSLEILPETLNWALKLYKVSDYKNLLLEIKHEEQQILLKIDKRNKKISNFLNWISGILIINILIPTSRKYIQENIINLHRYINKMKLLKFDYNYFMQSLLPTSILIFALIIFNYILIKYSIISSIKELNNWLPISFNKYKRELTKIKSVTRSLEELIYKQVNYKITEQ